MQDSSKKAAQIKNLRNQTSGGDTQENNEQNFNKERVTKNINSLRNMRTYGAINAGILSGVFGFDGFYGLIVYIIMFAVVTLCVLIKSEFKLQKYFPEENLVYFSGFGTDILLFLMVWVILHSFVYVL